MIKKKIAFSHPEFLRSLLLPPLCRTLQGHCGGRRFIIQRWFITFSLSAAQCVRFYPLEHFRSGLLAKKMGRYLLNCCTSGRARSLPRVRQSKMHFQPTVEKEEKKKKKGGVSGLASERVNLSSEMFRFSPSCGGQYFPTLPNKL